MRISVDSQKVVQAARRRTFPQAPKRDFGEAKVLQVSEVPESLLPGYKTLADVPGTSWFIRAKMAESNKKPNPDAGRIVFGKTGHERG
jgi:hypothetical protein